MLEMVSGQVWGLQAWERKYSGENRHSEGWLELLWGTPWPTRRASAASMFLGTICLNYPSLPDLGQPSVSLGWEGVTTLNSSWGSSVSITRATEVPCCSADSQAPPHTYRLYVLWVGTQNLC